MPVSVSVLSVLVVAALIGCALAPIFLIYFLFQDWRNKRLW